MEASGAPDSPDPTTEPAAPWWRWIALLAPIIAMAIVVAVVLVVVPR